MPKVIKRQSSPSYMDAARLNFTHGIASGDPYSDSVILWTRVAPTSDNDASNVTVSGTVPLYNHDTDEYVKASSNPVCVEYTVSESEDLRDPVSNGKAYTSSDIDYTVKVEATGLEPFTEYYYQFSVCESNVKSPLGRTKTAPTSDDDVTSMGLAVFSCSNFPTGFFNAYGNSARKDDVDFVIHLGDYIYEYATTTTARPVEPKREIFTLYDYRRRLATYRTDLDLLLSHQKFAWIPVWDDHEVSNNGYRDGSSGLNNTEESFVKHGGVSVDQRKMNAVRAYFEWMPIRQVDMDNNLRIWRSFSLGKLVDLIMLDTRNYDRSITTLGWNDVCGVPPSQKFPRVALVVDCLRILTDL
jgi:alkaline phosphatase D